MKMFNCPRSLGRVFVLLTLFLVVGQGVSVLSAQPQGKSEDKEGLTWAVGGGFVASPRPYPDADAEIIPIPLVTVRYKGLFFQGIRGGYEFLQKEKWTASVFGQARFQGLEATDSPFLQGMESRRKSVDAGTELVFRNRPVGFRMSFLSDILGRSKGQEFSALAVTGAPLGKALFLVGIGPRWESGRRIDYYYGVRPEEAVPGRPAYSGPATWSWDLNLTLSWPLSDRWSFLFLANRQGFGNGISNSPIIDQGAGYAVISALTYRIR
jgi:outer membrane protein